MSQDQLQTLIAALQNQQPQAIRPQQQKSAAALGHMRSLDLGPDKMQKLKLFNQWLEEAENRMKYLGSTTNEEKISLLRAWGGPELVSFMKLHAKVKLEITPATGDVEEIPADTYDETIKKIRDYLQGHSIRNL